MYNIFISYRRDGGYEMARLLYERLKALGYNPFLDLEELRSGPFNVRLYKTIEECQNFLVVISKGGLKRCENETDWLRLEIEHALNARGTTIIPVIMEGAELDPPPAIAALAYHNGVTVSREYFDASVAKIESMLSGTSPKHETEGTGRDQNTYFTYKNKKELERLAKQQELLRSFDRDAYAKILDKYDSLRILDVGSNNGDLVMDRLGYSPKADKLIGVEYDRQTVDEANCRYGEEGKRLFIHTDVESEEFVSDLQNAMDQLGVASFNVINVSMILLHLKNPFRLLKSLRKVMEKGGTIIIKDIDDGFNVAYPDADGAFERVMGICARNEASGFRHSGREIFSLLKKAGYVDCTLEKLCLTTAGMDYDDKSTFFDVYFSFIPEDLKLMLEKYPDDPDLKRDRDWLDCVYAELEERFLSDGFFFSLGFMLFSARR